MKVKKARQLKLKTGLKAGEHCWLKWNNLLKDLDNAEKQLDFVDCCRNDRKCLR
jgi:hypothetical protein